MDIKSKQDAIRDGENYFFTGRPCKHGHLAKRYIRNGGCYECLHPRVDILIPTLGEVLSPSKDSSIEAYSEINKTRFALIDRKLSIEERKLALKELKAEDRSLRLQDRQERKERYYRASVKKSRLIEVYCLIEPVDYETVLAMIWAFAVTHDPILRPEDLVKSKLKDKTFVMLCFPEDKAQILKTTNEMFDIRHGVVKTPDMLLVEEFMNTLDSGLTMDQKREALARALCVERNGQPVKPQLQLTRNASPTVTPLAQNVAKALALEDESGPDGDPR